MLREKLKNFNIFLGSSSPRRKILLSKLGLTFEVKVPNIKEDFPRVLENKKAPVYIAEMKANYLAKKISGNYLLVTADTMVLLENEILHKPKNESEAMETLKKLSNKKHQVTTGICVKTKKSHITFSSTTNVEFKYLNKKEIDYYIKNYSFLDKAGSYAIQEWIGLIGIKNIHGSYSNVVGLPLSDLYNILLRIK
tara:strand:- start:118 stop:702 length:585 start_codon:yes stop_codon:yes gene_type:complete